MKEGNSKMEPRGMPAFLIYEKNQGEQNRELKWSQSDLSESQESGVS